MDGFADVLCGPGEALCGATPRGKATAPAQLSVADVWYEAMIQGSIRSAHGFCAGARAKSQHQSGPAGAVISWIGAAVRERSSEVLLL